MNWKGKNKGGYTYKALYRLAFKRVPNEGQAYDTSVIVKAALSYSFHS